MNPAGSLILVVDDNPAGLYVKAHLLRKAGYQVRQAPTGQEALDQCGRETPQLVLLDVRLPDINGVELCRQIKTEYPGIAVLQTSAAVTSAHDRATALDGGADAFLVEPIEPEELLATAKALLRMHQAEQALRRLNETLEQQVAARTGELTESYQRLEVEVSERRKAEDALWHAQRLEAVGQLTGGIAHDFNNLLAVIVGTLEVLRNGLEAEGDLPRARMLRLVKAAQGATERGSKLTQQLLAFARRSPLRSEIARLGELFTLSEPLLRRAVGESVLLRVSFPPDLWPCRVDPAQFEAAILNLLVNARDAMPQGGTLGITAGNVQLDETDPTVPDGLPPGEYVCVQVTDSGVGMTPEVVTHVFEPFFTTKEVGKGTGLGLSQVYGFVKQSGGDVAIDSAPSAGTTVRLYFPRVDHLERPDSQAGKIVESVTSGTETVLVVEDDELVREMAVDTISALGYRVLTAPNGPEALEMLRNAGTVDLLFSDVVMPGGMNGYELVRKAREMRQGLKALVTSGYAHQNRPLPETVDVPLLTKPYRRAELAQQIRLVLEHG